MAAGIGLEETLSSLTTAPATDGGVTSGLPINGALSGCLAPGDGMATALVAGCASGPNEALARPPPPPLTPLETLPLLLLLLTAAIVAVLLAMLEVAVPLLLLPVF